MNRPPSPTPEQPNVRLVAYEDAWPIDFEPLAPGPNHVHNVAMLRIGGLAVVGLDGAMGPIRGDRDYGQQSLRGFHTRLPGDVADRLGLFFDLFRARRLQPAAPINALGALPYIAGHIETPDMVAGWAYMRAIQETPGPIAPHPSDELRLTPGGLYVARGNPDAPIDAVVLGLPQSSLEEQKHAVGLPPRSVLGLPDERGLAILDAVDLNVRYKGFLFEVARPDA
jgi:hypothetical protein